MKAGLFIFATWVSALMLASCGEKRTRETQTIQTERVETGDAHERIVTLTQEQVDAIGLELGNLEHKNLTATVRVNGTLAVPAQNKASVTSLYSGIVRDILVHPGSAVRKGQTIATVAITELAGLQQQLISVNAQLKLAGLELKRQEELVAGNAAPLKNLQRAQSELNSLRAQQAALSKQLTALGVSASSVSTGNISSILRITAPISGTISDIHAQIGSQVNAATPVAEIVNNTQLHLDLFVYEKDLPKVSEGQVIHFTLTNNPGREYDARIYSIGTAFANETKAVPVHAEVQGDKTGLIEGMSVTAIISIGATTSPAVPADAIVTSGGKDYLFVRTNEPAHAHEEAPTPEQSASAQSESIVFERIEVQKGTSDLGYTQIIPVEEIPAGAKIVVKGAFFLLAKMTNAGGHDH